MTMRGKLKIYFGYSAGVGKTYSMLKDAHQEMRSGVDVVVGYIEPSSSEETMEMMEGLEVLPSKIMNNGKGQIYEFNLEGALSRKPQLILVDEMAHVNATGSKHEKRYLDIEELLVAGINVYTTLNAQQVESLADSITEIVKKPTEETVSDFLFDYAERVELVDIEPIELIKRFREGKVLKKETTDKTIYRVFRKKNLDMLRELSINRTKDRIDKICNWY